MSETRLTRVSSELEGLLSEQVEVEQLSTPTPMWRVGQLLDYSLDASGRVDYIVISQRDSRTVLPWQSVLQLRARRD